MAVYQGLVLPSRFLIGLDQVAPDTDVAHVACPPNTLDPIDRPVVEAYVPGMGWQIFDPTPPGGRPTAGEEGALQFFRQA